MFTYKELTQIIYLTAGCSLTSHALSLLEVLLKILPCLNSVGSITKNTSMLYLCGHTFPMNGGGCLLLCGDRRSHKNSLTSTCETATQCNRPRYRKTSILRTTSNWQCRWVSLHLKQQKKHMILYLCLSDWGERSTPIQKRSAIWNPNPKRHLLAIPQTNKGDQMPKAPAQFSPKNSSGNCHQTSSQAKSEAYPGKTNGGPSDEFLRNWYNISKAKQWSIARPTTPTPSIEFLQNWDS